MFPLLWLKILITPTAKDKVNEIHRCLSNFRSKLLCFANMLKDTPGFLSRMDFTNSNGK